MIRGYELKKYYATGTPTADYSGMNWAITRHLQLVIQNDIKEYCIDNDLPDHEFAARLSSTYAEFKLIPIKGMVFKTPSDVVTYLKRKVERDYKIDEPEIFAAICVADSDILEQCDIITDAYRATPNTLGNKRRKSLRHYPLRTDIMWVFYGLYAECTN